MTPDNVDPPTFERQLEDLINRFSQENASNTPDFILARYLFRCLAAWNEGVQERERWYGRVPTENAGTGNAPRVKDELEST